MEEDNTKSNAKPALHFCALWVISYQERTLTLILQIEKSHCLQEKKKEKKRKKNRGNDKKIDFDLKGRKKVDKINLERLKRKMKTWITYSHRKLPKKHAA